MSNRTWMCVEFAIAGGCAVMAVMCAMTDVPVWWVPGLSAVSSTGFGVWHYRLEDQP